MASKEFQERAAEICEKLEELGWSKAEAARQIGRGHEAGRVYVRTVLVGKVASNPILNDIEAAIERHQLEEAA